MGKYTYIFWGYFMPLLERQQKRYDKKMGETQMGNNIQISCPRLGSLLFMVSSLNSQGTPKIHISAACDGLDALTSAALLKY